ncbi:MAG: c-type cytochrome [Burkholderiaceae bacterium]|jgi:cytochrome c553|nr:c-type cytochrome [Burkholderiaceae bacterium]
MKLHIGIHVAALLLGTAGLSVGWAAPSDDAAPAAVALEQLQKAEADAALGAAVLQEGTRVAAVCANCHGPDGNSTYPETPNLAAQNPRYLLVQMEKFIDGRRRYEFMEGMLKAMTPQERVGAALFYSRQKVTSRASADAALRAQGKTYYEKVCFRCHGSDGRGSEEYARLAGQQSSYVMTALKRYRDNAQDGVRRDPLMAATTKLMSDDDIRAVAAYVVSMP